MANDSITNDAIKNGSVTNGSVTSDTITIPVITTDENHQSIFAEQGYPMDARGEMVITPQIQALNLRLRKSAAGYSSDWHVAGDPTLIVVQQGTVRISLRDGSYQDFGVGSCFIARDALPEGMDFDDNRHGHRAELLGEDDLQAIHIKLAQL